MYCSKCGKQSPEGTRFCQYCGQPMEGAQPPRGTPAAGYQQPYARPVQQGPAHSTGSPALDAIKRLGTSPAFLVAIIAYSLYIVFYIASAVSGGGGLSALIRNLMSNPLYSSSADYAEFESIMGAYTMMGNISIVFSIVTAIPAILLCVGMWLMFFTSNDKSGAPMRTAGLSIIKVITIIQLVLICLSTFVIELIVILFTVSLGSQSSYLGKSGSYVVGILVAVILLIAVCFICSILYQAKILKVLKTLKNNILTASSSDDISMYVIVFTFICGGCAVITSLMNFNLLSFVSSMSNAVALIAFGVFLLNYRNQMRLVPAGSYQAPPAPEPGPIYSQAPAAQPAPPAAPVQQPAYAAPAAQPFEPVLNIPVAPAAPAMPEPPQPAGETAVLMNKDSGCETTVLSAPAPKCAVLTRLKDHTSAQIARDEFRIGKDAVSVDYLINDNTAVSRQHADILRRGEMFYIVDLDSTNHTYVNGEQIPSHTEVKLESGAALRLGDEEFLFEIS